MAAKNMGSSLRPFLFSVARFPLQSDDSGKQLFSSMLVIVPYGNLSDMSSLNPTYKN